MRKQAVIATALFVSAQCFYGIPKGHAAGLLWEVENPYRFFKRTSSFDAQERAFDSVRGASGQPLPSNIMWRLERRLNDPDCKDPSTPDSCFGTARANYKQSRLGWAAQTVDFTCYDRNARPRHYLTTCERQYSWGAAKEDYILPDAHTVDVHIAPDQLAAAGQGDCAWTWQGRRPGAPVETRTQPCNAKLVIKRVPFSLDRALSGVSVKVRLPNGTQLDDADVAVEDLFVVAFGDSFASGESNPDRPVTFSATRQMLYDPVNVEAENKNMASREPAKTRSNYEVASAEMETNPKALPKRLMEDEEKGLLYHPASREFAEAFDRRDAQWLSADCHRSQYGYPFRVSMGLALENRHRAVTFVSLACSGADIVEGLFADREAREQTGGPNAQKRVPAQFDQLTDLICRNGAAHSEAVSYRLPVYKAGSTAIGEQVFTKQWCPPESRKRPIDIVLLSVGGNDVGFGGLVAYAITDRASDIAPIVGLVGQELRYPPSVSETYLQVLDRRIQAVKQALRDGFGVDPGRVLHNVYEPIQFDETGNVCGLQPTLGLDVFPKFRYDRARTQEVSNFTRELQGRLECMTDARPGCPAGLATGAGTGFHLITDHVAEFARRGVCARDPQKALLDQREMAMPRVSSATGDFAPYSPAGDLPYAHRWRLVRDPNDAFLAANTHREGISPFDDLQPPYAALYSGAFHPTAEGHAIVADHVLRHVNAVLESRGLTAGTSGAPQKATVTIGAPQSK